MSRSACEPTLNHPVTPGGDASQTRNCPAHPPEVVDPLAIFPKWSDRWRPPCVAGTRPIDWKIPMPETGSADSEFDRGNGAGNRGLRQRRWLRHILIRGNSPPTVTIRGNCGSGKQSVNYCRALRLRATPADSVLTARRTSAESAVEFQHTKRYPETSPKIVPASA